MITSVQLKGDNYNEWEMEMMNALRAKKKIGFSMELCLNRVVIVQIWSHG